VWDEIGTGIGTADGAENGTLRETNVSSSRVHVLEGGGTDEDVGQGMERGRTRRNTGFWIFEVGLDM